MSEKIKILKTVKLSFGIAELRDDGILTFTPDPNSVIYNISQLKEMLDVFKEMTNGKPHLYFSDNNNIKISFDGQSKTFMGEHFHEFATAFAMIENSAITRYITHTFIYLNRPQIPIRMFKTKEAAIEWLKQHD